MHGEDAGKDFFLLVWISLERAVTAHALTLELLRSLAYACTRCDNKC
jgi:hypothetical protein